MSLQTDHTVFHHFPYWDGIGIAKYICKWDMVEIKVQARKNKALSKYGFFIPTTIFRHLMLLALLLRWTNQPKWNSVDWIPKNIWPIRYKVQDLYSSILFIQVSEYWCCPNTDNLLQLSVKIIVTMFQLCLKTTKPNLVSRYKHWYK